MASDRNVAQVDLIVDKLSGLTLDYLCSDGLRFVIRFHDGKASYWAVGQDGWISNRNDSIPYRCRELRPGLICAVCHEQCLGDIVTLVIDFEEQKIFSTALWGYPADERRLYFEDGSITAVVRES